MTATPRTRPFVCLLLVLCLCSSILAIAAPAAERERATELRALAAPYSAILLTRASDRRDDARQRSYPPSCVALVSLHGAASDPGRPAAALQLRCPRSLWTAGPRRGRSPPAAIS